VDAESWFDQVRSRALNSKIAWLQRDPLVDISANVSLYEYVLSNPLVLLDPYGLVDMFGPGGVIRATLFLASRERQRPEDSDR
jgi:hypothetical protein